MEGDIIYVNKVMFWFTMTRKLQFLTIERVKNRKKNTILQAMRNVLVFYKSKRMRVKTLYVDPELAPMRSELMDIGTSLNVASANEHVAGV